MAVLFAMAIIFAIAIAFAIAIVFAGAVPFTNAVSFAVTVFTDAFAKSGVYSNTCAFRKRCFCLRRRKRLCS